jgi:hypothetical protein
MNTFKGMFLLKKEKNETVCAIKELCDSYSGRQANNTKEEKVYIMNIFMMSMNV